MPPATTTTRPVLAAEAGTAKEHHTGNRPDDADRPAVPAVCGRHILLQHYGPGTFPLLDIALLTDIVLQKNPAANTNPASLLAGSGCYNNYSAQSWLVKLGLLQEISQSVNPSAPTDAASLLSAAMCYNCYGPGIWPLLEVQLLN